MESKREKMIFKRALKKSIIRTRNKAKMRAYQMNIETSAKADAKVLDEENVGFCSKKMEKVSDKYEFLDVIARMRGL